MAHTTVGVQAGTAQRMESVAPAGGGVMVSESTARLVASRSILGERELVHIRGAHEPVPVRRLLAHGDPVHELDRAQAGSLVHGNGSWNVSLRDWTGSINGNGSVVGIVGPVRNRQEPNVGEVTSLALRDRG